MAADRNRQDALYAEAAAAYGPALGRLARSYERDADTQRDLLQDVHIALWRSFAGFEDGCSLRTWVYRVAHNIGASHIVRERRRGGHRLVGLEEVEATLASRDGATAFERSHALDRVYELIHRLKPLDRQIILLYLEGSDAASIADVTGVSPGNAATRVHRIKSILARRYHGGSTT